MIKAFQAKDGNIFFTEKECIDYEKTIPVPTIKENIDYTPLIEQIQEYLAYLESDEYHEDNDFKDYIYETAIEVVIGESFWKYINSK